MIPVRVNIGFCAVDVNNLSVCACNKLFIVLLPFTVSYETAGNVAHKSAPLATALSLPSAISRQLFVVISVVFWVGNMELMVNYRSSSDNESLGILSVQKRRLPLVCNPIVGVSHDTFLPQQLNGISILSTPARRVYPAGFG